jgi:hypothetical protein
MAASASCEHWVHQWAGRVVGKDSLPPGRKRAQTVVKTSTRPCAVKRGLSSFSRLKRRARVYSEFLKSGEAPK